MNKEGISEYQGVALVSMQIWGGIFTAGAAAGANKWIILIIATILSVPLLITFARIMSNFPGKNLYDILEIVLGKGFGKVIVLLYTLFFFHLGAIILRSFIEFTRVTTLPETPIIITAIIFVLACAYVVRQGIKTFGRWAGVFFIGITFVAVFIGVFVIIYNPNELSFFYIFNNDINLNAFQIFSFITYPIAQVISFMPIFNSLKNKDSQYTVFVKGVLFALSVALLDIIAIEFLMVSDESEKMFFPTFLALRRIRVGSFIQRIETIVAAQLSIYSIVEFSVCLFAVCKGAAKICDFKDYKSTAVSVSLLSVGVALILYESTLEMVQWDTEIWPYYSFPFLILMPIVILILGEIKIRKNKLSLLKNEKGREEESLGK